MNTLSRIYLAYFILQCYDSTTTGRTIQFSGRTWTVKESGSNVYGPGPNFWSPDDYHVQIDSNGSLHLRISNTTGKWTCSEVVLTESLGYGTYTWILDAEADVVDPQAVVGLFTYSHNSSYAHREIDVELARWGDASEPTNAQYVVQPWHNPGNLRRFVVPSGVRNASYSFRWAPDRVDFETRWKDGGRFSWTFNDSGEVPPPGDETPIVNFWLFRGAPPTSGQHLELIVKEFRYVALGNESPTLTSVSSVSNTGTKASTTITASTSGAKKINYMLVLCCLMGIMGMAL